MRLRLWPKRRGADVILPNHRDLRSHLYRIEGERFVLEGWSRDSDGCVRLDLLEESAFRRRYESGHDDLTEGARIINEALGGGT